MHRGNEACCMPLACVCVRACACVMSACFVRSRSRFFSCGVSVTTSADELVARSPLPEEEQQDDDEEERAGKCVRCSEGRRWVAVVLFSATSPPALSPATPFGPSGLTQ